LEQLCDSDLDCLSDDEFDDYDDDMTDATWTPPPADTQSNNQIESESSSDEEDISSQGPIQSQTTARVQNTSRSAIQWYNINERRKLEPGSTDWRGHMDLGEPLDTPAQYFIKYFTPPLLQTFSEETNKYYCRMTGQSLRTTSQEIQKFFGMSILMANLKYPRQRMYWNHITRVDRIASAMPVNRFQKIRNNLHINSAKDPDPNDCNKFWKIQPLVDCIRRRCMELPREEYCSVDEQMIPFQGRAPAKQFVANKPNPIGLKNFVLCGKSGRALDFELYQGAGTGIPDKYKDLCLGLGASIVLRLSETLPKQVNHKMIFDNYFTGMPLIRELKKEGIHSLGVVRQNKLRSCPLKAAKELKKEGRGAIDSKVSKEKDITVVSWFDNSHVTLASSFVGVEPLDSVKRWSAAEKAYVMVRRPACVQVYND